MDPINSRSKCSTQTQTTPKTGSTTVYDLHFEQHVTDHGIFLPSYKYPDDTKPTKPDNFADIHRRLRVPRPSLALSRGSLEKEYEEFIELNDNAARAQLVVKDILPVLEGKRKACFNTDGGHPFNNLAPLTDGTLANAKPDFYHGASPNQLKPGIREQLNSHIMPSTQSSRPVAPNFFVEAKGHAGSIPVAKRQACYDGALGARAMHALQQYGHEGSSNYPTHYDNNAYTLTSTFHAGTLGLYATHPTRSTNNDNSDRHTDYVMTQVGQWALHGDPETYQRGLNAYRNARDLARELRDGFIGQANEQYTAGQDDDSNLTGSEETS